MTSIGDSHESGAVDPYQRAFGQPGLHVIDGSVMPANTGVNPSLSITALAERALSLWPNKGDVDLRPPLGSGYERIAPVMPHRPIVPAGAPAELRLDAAGVIDLSTNVHPDGPPPEVIEALRNVDVSHYPSVDAAPLRDAIAHAHDLDPACVVVTHAALRAREAAAQPAVARRGPRRPIP